ncbi:hypothetical protein D3C86_1962610 [compost metagenome]
MVAFFTVALGVPLVAAFTGVFATGLTVAAGACAAGVFEAVLVVLLTIVLASGCISVVFSTTVSAGISVVFTAGVLGFRFIITVFLLSKIAWC